MNSTIMRLRSALSHCEARQHHATTDAERESLAFEAARLKAQLVYAEALAEIRGDRSGMESPSGFRPRSGGPAYVYAGGRSRSSYRRGRDNGAVSTLVATGTLAATFILAAIVAVV
jgi:hypothetical protein